MDKTTPPTIKKKKKTLNACQRCRNRKIKCSGQTPCQHCMSRSFVCVFEDRPRKLVVSEDYLTELQKRASAVRDTEAGQASTSPTTPAKSTRNTTYRARPMEVSGFSSSDLESQAHASMPATDPGTVVNELPDGPDQLENVQSGSEESQYAIGDEFRRLGHSSSWAFSRRIRNMINDVTGGSVLHDAVPIRDGAYGIPWKKPVIDLSGIDLPSEDYAEYLTHTVSFTLGPLYYLYDRDTFLKRLHLFYADEGGRTSQSSDPWLIQMLIVFAFGKSILAREVGPSGPTGVVYFSKAFEALPDCHRLHENPILAIETLSLIALFMQTIDMRMAAHEYIGQAARMCLIHGMNRVYDAKRISLSEFEHRSKLWWTVYIVDRKLSSLVGVPSAVHDADIAVARPSMDGTKSKTLTFSLHVELSSQLGRILNVVYGLGLERQLGGKFVSAIQSILHRLAETSLLLNSSMKIELHRPMNTISREAASLHLLHHQCSILAIRPVLFFLFETKIRSRNNVLLLSDAVIGLLRVCIESSLQILKIVETLRLHKLVDLLLPFDLDSMFAAAFVLVLVDIITPAASEQWDLNKTLSLMDEMILRGIVTAGPYKQDLIELSEMGQKHKDIQHQEIQQSKEGATASHESHQVSESVPHEATTVQPEQEDPIWSWMATDDGGLGELHPDTIQSAMSAIDGLNFDFLNDPSALQMDGSEWMWGNGSLPWPDTN
ncbi:hypothetical protein PVAG01_11228 [Phlyctema vagabunda]|uniref:Zn(2)-C6 fungal-type domain-containing protein n=1 Tax=Phlyctema vagabunda TaxID=108571 RepID=A0ABR4P1Q2_9HELO